MIAGSAISSNGATGCAYAEARLAEMRRQQGISDGTSPNGRASSEHFGPRSSEHDDDNVPANSAAEAVGAMDDPASSEHSSAGVHYDFKDQEDNEARDGKRKNTTADANSAETAASRLAGGDERAGDPGQDEPRQETRPDTSQRKAYLAVQAVLDRGQRPTVDVYEMALAALGWMQENEPNRPAWQTGVFDFERFLKASPRFDGIDAKSALKTVEDVFDHWAKDHKFKGRKADRIAQIWLRFFDADADDAREEFIDAWERIRLVPGRTPLEQARRQALERPIEFRDGMLTCDTEGYRDFLSLAGWLQVAVGSAEILLPVEKIAVLLGCKHMSVSRYRRWAIKDGFLREVEAYQVKQRKATKFLFDVRRVPMLSDVAHADVLGWVAEHFDASGGGA